MFYLEACLLQSYIWNCPLGDKTEEGVRQIEFCSNNICISNSEKALDSELRI